MILEESIEEVPRLRREGLEERVFLLQNLCLSIAQDQHLLAVLCDHVFGVGQNPIEAGDDEIRTILAAIRLPYLLLLSPHKVEQLGGAFWSLNCRTIPNTRRLS